MYFHPNITKLFNLFHFITVCYIYIYIGTVFFVIYNFHSSFWVYQIHFFGIHSFDSIVMEMYLVEDNFYKANNSVRNISSIFGYV